MTTINEIRVRFDDARAAIAQLDQDLAAERSEIRKTAFREARRPLTPPEIARRKEIASTRTELADALETLALDTIDVIEADEGLHDVIHGLQSINLQLDDDLKRLREITRHAKNAASVAASMANLVDKLIGLRPTTT